MELQWTKIEESAANTAMNTMIKVCIIGIQMSYHWLSKGGVTIELEL